MTMAIPVLPAGIKPPPGLESPPGLGSEYYGNFNHMLPSQKSPAVLETQTANWGPAHSTRLSSKATPFQPKFDSLATGCRVFEDSLHLRRALTQYPGLEDDAASFNLGGPTQQCVQNLTGYPSQKADGLAEANNNLQQTLLHLNGALTGWEPCIPKSNQQDMQLDTSVQFLQQTLAHLKGSLAELEPNMPKRDGKDGLDKSAQHLQQTLFQLKGALAAWEPSKSKSDEHDECSSQGSRSSKFSSQASSYSGSTKSGSSKGSSSSSSKGSMTSSGKSSSSKSSRRSKSKHSSSKDASVAAAPDIAIAAEAAPVIDTYAYQPELDPTLTMMWGAQSSPFTQPAWQCGWPGPGTGNWADPKLPAPVSISNSLTSEFRDASYDLKRIDPSFILVVRKIYRLGLESGAWLKAYFSKYGIVDKILVGNSRSRVNSPACIGFVVMSTAADVQSILRAGTEHVINGVCITLRPYRKPSEEAVKEEAPSAEMPFQ